MKKLLSCAVLLAGLALPALAQEDSAASHDAHHPATRNTADMTQGEVRRIDLAGGRITLRHGPIANLGMPPMTMVFVVSDKAQLEGLAVGDKVQFVADKQGSQYVLTELKAAD